MKPSHVHCRDCGKPVKPPPATALGGTLYFVAWVCDPCWEKNGYGDGD